MKICPKCGSDVLGGGDVRTCTSCGADLQQAKASPNDSGNDREGTPTSSLDSRYNDAPISKSDDLEVVTSGEAFWVKSGQDEEPPPPEPTAKVESNDEPTEPVQQEAEEPVKRPSSLISIAPKPNADAPSLAELAQRRKEMLRLEEEARKEEEARNAEEAGKAEAGDEAEETEEPEVTPQAEAEQTPETAEKPVEAEAAEETTKPKTTPEPAPEQKPEEAREPEASHKTEEAHKTLKAERPEEAPKAQEEPKSDKAPKPVASEKTEAEEKKAPATADTKTSERAKPVETKPTPASEAPTKKPEPKTPEPVAASEAAEDSECTSPIRVPKGDSVPTLAGLTDSGGGYSKKSEAAPPAAATAASSAKPDESTDPETDAQDIKVVTQAPQIAYFEGNTVTVPGAHWTSGDKMLISGRPYQLKRALSKSWLTRERMMLIGGGALGGFLLALMISSMGGGPSAKLFGAVRDAKTGTLLPGVSVSIDELNETIQTDETGMFLMDGLEEGVYTLSGSDPIYGAGSSRVTLSGNEASILLDLGGTSHHPKANPPAKKKSGGSSTSKQASNSKPEPVVKPPGKIAFTAPVSNAELYLDGKLLGVGNGTYGDIKSGSHRLLVKRDGYENWEDLVTVDRGETVRVKPKLKAEAKEAAPQLSPEQHYQRGRAAIESRDYKKALAEFDAALEGKSWPKYYAWRAEANVGLGNTSAAEHDYLKAIDGFDKSQQYSQIDQLIDRAVQAVSSSAALWLTRGDYMIRRRKPSTAVKSYRRALDVGGDRFKAYMGIGRGQYAQGNFAKANDAWTEADHLSGEKDAHVAGYLALANAWLQYRTSCRKFVQRVEANHDVLTEFRRHPDWSKVQRLTGSG